MKKISTDKKKRLLKQVMWDYNVSPDILLDILKGKHPKYAHIDRKYIIHRCFNYLSWYQFVSLFDRDELPDVLSLLIPTVSGQELSYESNVPGKAGKNTIAGLEFAKRFLRKEALSASG